MEYTYVMGKRNILKTIPQLLRVKQYFKNVLIFAPSIFDGQLLNRTAMLHCLAGFVILCMLSSSIYIFNDIIDLESDRRHPRKCRRPIASGAIPVHTAAVISVCLCTVSMVWAFFLSKTFCLICLMMLLINLAYSLKLKHIALIDVMTIGILFLLRVACGAVLVTVKLFSPWLYVVTFMLALYLGFGKRRAELALMKEAGTETRPVLDGYSLLLLDQLITIVSSVTIMSYTLYTFSGPTLPEGNKMMLTIPFVVYGIFRYQYLIQMKHEGGAPEEVLISDRCLQAAILGYGITAVLALYL